MAPPTKISDRNDIKKIVSSAKTLVVGAGGIGCELVKTLLLMGFTDIVIIDLDTIDVSNLNRQFLFQKQHVGKSKAVVAKEAAQPFNPQAKIVAHHNSIMSSEYDVEYFQQFAVVTNALDNRAARNHVNRMCLAAGVPLVESGSAGHLGQVTVIKKGLTECYECQPKEAQKTFPGCTIRNTPSEPIHCIVWAKHLFNQLFGESDADEDVSPDVADPELGGNFSANLQEGSNGNVERLSTRSWAVSCAYDPEKLFIKLFSEDIGYLLTMDNLWKTRRKPTALDWNHLPRSDACSSNAGNQEAGMRDQLLWSVQDCANIFSEAVQTLKKRTEQLDPEDHLVWDKDDDICLNFVTACANIRSYCFGIPQTSRFDVKSMAGNIIPAIATTNAIIAGLIVLQCIKVLTGTIEECRTVYLNRQPKSKKKLLAPCLLVPPNPNCHVCSPKPEVQLYLNTSQVTVHTLEEKILKGHLNMVAPDVEIDDGKGTILISSEEGETTGNAEKVLSTFGIRNSSRLKCDDFLQNFKVVVIIRECDRLPEGVEFEVKGKAEKMPDLAEESASPTPLPDTVEGDSDDDLVVIEDEDLMYISPVPKRKVSLNVEDIPSKKLRMCQDGDVEISD